MKKDGILRIQAKDLKKKKVISKKIVKHFNDKGIIVIENILSKPKCNFYINLLEKVYKKLNNRNSLNSKENPPPQSVSKYVLELTRLSQKA